MFVLYYMVAVLMLGTGVRGFIEGPTHIDRAISVLIFAGIMCVAAEVSKNRRSQ